jgi:hypothetical protein
MGEKIAPIEQQGRKRAQKAHENELLEARHCPIRVVTCPVSLYPYCLQLV